jgi:eukaryotic-like serine/threonine-protein kinase
MSLAYQGARGDELARHKGDSREERRKQIFDLYVEQMFRRKGITSLVFPKEKIIGWLSWLARKMREQSQSVFLVEGLQPSWLGTRAQRGAYGSVVALSLGLIYGLLIGATYGLGGELIGVSKDELIFDPLSEGPILGLIIFVACWSESPLKNGVMSGSIGFLIKALIFGPLSGLIPGLTKALGDGLIFGLIVGLGVGSLNRITLVETMSWKWNQFWKRTIPGSIVGLIGGLIGGLIFGLIFGLTEELIGVLIGELILGLILGLFFGLIVGLVSGLVGGFTDTVKVGKAFPNQGIKLSGKNSLAAFLVAWLIIGLILGLIYGLIVGLIYGLIVGLIVGLNRGGSAVIKHYALRLTLWRRGYTPFKFIKFLDHCGRLILLKKVGGGYIFIHRMLLEYFAELTPRPTKVEDNQETKGVGDGLS